MRVTLCYPPVVPGVKPRYGLQPLGLLSVGTVLRRAGHTVRLIDAEIEGLTVAATVARILADTPDVVGFSLMTSQLESGRQCAAGVKAARPETTIIAGGAHVNSSGDDILRAWPGFDLAVRGEAEPVIAATLARLATGNAPGDWPPGVYHRGPAGVVGTPAEPPAGTLDCRLDLDYDQLDMARYRVPNLPGRTVISLMASRGCPYRCVFCDASSSAGRAVRLASPAAVAARVAALARRYQTTSFVFKDSVLTIDRAWTLSLSECLARLGLPLSWRCSTRVDLVDREMLVAMRRAGCRLINFGVEAGEAFLRDQLGKPLPEETIAAAHRLTRELGIMTFTTFILGVPGETRATIDASIALAIRLRPTFAMFFTAVAYPGTELYRDGVARGLVSPDWWNAVPAAAGRTTTFERRWGWTAPAGALTLPGLDLAAEQRRANRAFYLRPGYVCDFAATIRHQPFLLRHAGYLASELLRQPFR